MKKQKKKLVLLGFSSASCGRFCAQFESTYAEFTATLSAEFPKDVHFARMDGDREQLTATKYGVDNLPAIVAFKKGQKSAVTYNGVHGATALLSYTRKALAPPVAKLSSAEDVHQFISAHNDSTVVVGFFKSADADEHEDWEEGAEALSLRADVWLAELVDPIGELLSVFSAKPHRWYKRTPAVVVFRRPLDAGTARTDDDRAAVELETLTEGSVELWVDSNSIPSCGKLDPLTFNQYERSARRTLTPLECYLTASAVVGQARAADAAAVRVRGRPG